jgi:ribosomal protein S6--L-glutamate ligase
MRIAVLGSAENWYLEDLRRAAAQQHEIVPALWREVAAAVEAGQTRVWAGRVALDQFDAVLVRTMPTASLEQIVFRMDALASLHAGGVPVINSPKAVETAIDKYLTLARVQAAGLPVPRTIACQSADEALAAFEQLGGDVVVKPLFGSEGRGLVHLCDRGLAERVLQLFAQQGAVLYVQQFLRHPGHDFRVLVIGQRVLAMRRASAGDWRTNVSRGGVATACELTEQMAHLARQSAAAVGASIAGVDLLPDDQGRLHVLEVNAVPGWKGSARALQVDVARIVIEHVAQLVQEARQA